MSDNAILSVVETLSGIKWAIFSNNLDNAEFWKNLSPFKNTDLTLVQKGKYTYHIKDTVVLEPITNFTYDLDFTGEILYESMATTPDKGYAFLITVKINETDGIAKARVRVRDTPQGLKVGMFIFEMEYTNKSGLPITRDMVLFATRVKIREGMELVGKKLK